MTKQLNNNKNGQVFTIKSVKGNNVEVIKYVNDSVLMNYGFESVEVEGLNDLIYAQLKAKLGEDYDTSESKINWLFEPENRLFRMSIPNELYAVETLEGSTFGQLILQMITYFKPYVINEAGISLVYLEEIYPEHYAIVNPYLANDSVKLEQLIDGEIIVIKELV